MNNWRNIWQKLRVHKRVQWVIGISLALAYMFFLDPNSIMVRIRNKQKISALRDEIEHYRALYNEDKRRLQELDSTTNAIHKIARERYFMKAANEDVFIFAENDSAQ